MFEKQLSSQLFRQLEQLHAGKLTVTTPDGITQEFEGKQSGETADIVLHNWCVIRDIFRKGDIGLAETYQAGHWSTHNLTALITVCLQNKYAVNHLANGNMLYQMVSALSYLFRLNSLKGSKKNIHAHYDLGNDFYQLWLDPSMTYSSALFNNDHDTLEQAQNNKYDRIINCLQQHSGHLLEVGCGWGGFAQRAQDRGDFAIKGITLSEAQYHYARHRLGKKANIVLEDYRHQQGQYHHIVSIEMFEAVGKHYWKTYFSKIASLLHKKGKAVIQTITINDNDFSTYRRGTDFIRSYIFPGGMLPSPRVFQNAARQASLHCHNPFCFGQDYAKTLEQWLRCFDNKRDQVKALGFDENFIRLWRFYLAGCIASFRTGHTNVMQIELSHV